MITYLSNLVGCFNEWVFNPTRIFTNRLISLSITSEMDYDYRKDMFSDIEE